jgi:hypothetical protein
MNKCATCGATANLRDKPTVKDSFYGLQYICDDDGTCWNTYKGWWCDTCQLLHDNDTTMESDNSCQLKATA